MSFQAGAGTLVLLDELGAGASVLVVVDASDPRLEVSSRNLPGVDVIRAEGLNVVSPYSLAQTRQGPESGDAAAEYCDVEILNLQLII